MRQQVERLDLEDPNEGERIQTASWSDKTRCSALALDGRKRSARLGTTNAVGMTATTLREKVVKVVKVVR